MAQNGIKVVAIDPSEVAVNTINEAAKMNNLNIVAIKADFDHFVPDSLPYSAVCLFGLFQLLSWEEIDHLIDKINVWLTLNGLLFIAAFNVDDFSFDIYKKTWSSVGRNSFKKGGNNYRTFLAKDEILTLFKNYEVIYHWEGLGEKHRHGDREPHRHGLVHTVFQKSGKHKIW